MKEAVIFLLLIVCIFAYFGNREPKIIEKEVVREIKVPEVKEVIVEKVVEKPVIKEKEVVYNHYFIRGVRGYVVEKNGYHHVVRGRVSDFQPYFPGIYLRGASQ